MSTAKTLLSLRNVVRCFAVTVASMIWMCGCSGSGSGSGIELTEADTLTEEATLLTLIQLSDGITIAEVADPWDNTRTLASYILIDRDIESPDPSLTDGHTVIRTPVESALVYSSVHTSAIEELGASQVIKGVADGRYFVSDYIRKGLNAGTIVDVGNSMSPSLEKIVELSPDIVMTSPYQNAGHGVLDKAGVAVVDMADYMEPTPLARAEWILLVGALTGKLEEAKNVYRQVTENYNSLKKSSSERGAMDYRPLVLTEIPYGGVWYQPGGCSYAANMIKDAGARTLTEDDNSTGSVQFDIANVYESGEAADIWLIKSTGSLSKRDILSELPLATGFKSFNEDEIWIADTEEVPLYDDLAFHPDRVLSDYVAIFTGKAKSGKPLRYFKRVKS